MRTEGLDSHLDGFASGVCLVEDLGELGFSEGAAQAGLLLLSWAPCSAPPAEGATAALGEAADAINRVASRRYRVSIGYEKRNR